MPKNILIVGASKGLGKAILQGLSKKGDTIFTISRSHIDTQNLDLEAKIIQVNQDLTQVENLQGIYKIIQDKAIDVLIYNAGIWETDSFEKVRDKDIIDIMNVNLTSAILLIKNLLPNLRKSKKAHLILIGSTAGLENVSGDSVAYTASKFGLRGMAGRYREILKKDKVAVTIVNPGGMATDIDLNQGVQKTQEVYGNQKIPMQDMVDTIQYITNLSFSTCPIEINIPAMLDVDC